MHEIKRSKVTCIQCLQELEPGAELSALCASCLEQAKDPLVGNVFGGKYRVLCAIGSGAMGQVYAAYHEQLKVEVALKVLPDTGMTAQRLQRFQHEAKLMSAVVHSNVVRVLDFGVDPVPYIVMEKIHGVSLDTLITKEPLPPARVIEISQGICDAMSVAHAEGLLHRDLKPSNVMIDSQNGTVKVIDFGLAKAFLDDVKLTRTGETVGSPPYMSPEQCCGEGLDMRTDVYSLGCLMYEALTGVRPFEAESIVAAIFKHLEVNAPPFSKVYSKGVFPKGLETVVMNCLNKSKELRYQSMSAVKDDLLRVCQRKKIVRLVKRAPRKKMLLRTSVAVLLPCLYLGYLALFPELPEPITPTGNSLAVGNDALVQETVQVQLQPRASLNGLSKDAFFAARLKQIDQHRKTLIQSGYQPFRPIFSQIDFATGWLSYEGLCYYGQNGPKMVEGKSAASDVMLNPLLMVAPAVYIGSGWRTKFMNADPKRIHDFPYNGEASNLSFQPRKKTMDITVDFNAVAERTLEVNNYTEFELPEGEGQKEVRLSFLNAYDFGYNFMYVSVLTPSGTRIVTERPRRVSEIYRRHGNFHGVACNVGHCPSLANRYYGACVDFPFPATQEVRLWKAEPKSAKQEPDLTCFIHYLYDKELVYQLQYLRSRKEAIVANEGADSTCLLSVYRRIACKLFLKGENLSALEQYGLALKIAAHHPEAAEDLGLLLEEIGMALRKVDGGLELLDRVAAKQDWPPSAIREIKNNAAKDHAEDK